jgi:hypothetical protein
VYLIGIVWFALASAACGLAPDVTFLIITRVLQGAGAALLTPGSLAILQASFRPADRAGLALPKLGALGPFGHRIGGQQRRSPVRWPAGRRRPARTGRHHRRGLLAPGRTRRRIPDRGADRGRAVRRRRAARRHHHHQPRARAPPSRRCHVRPVPALRPRRASTDTSHQPDSRYQVASLAPQLTRAPAVPGLPVGAAQLMHKSFHGEQVSPSSARLASGEQADLEQVKAEGRYLGQDAV